MRNLLEKSAKGSGIIAGTLIPFYLVLFVADKNCLSMKSFIVLLAFIVLLVFLFLYIWNSYVLLERKDLLEKQNYKKTNELKKQIKKNNHLKENNKGLLDEREVHKKELKEKDKQIDKLNAEINELRIRVLFHERSNNFEL